MQTEEQQSIEEARAEAARDLAELARTYSLRAKKNPQMRIAFAELESELNKRVQQHLPLTEAAA